MVLVSFDPRANCNRVLRRALGAFSNDSRGSIAILFALLSIPLLAATFFAIDYSRAASVKTKLQSAADSAAITASMRLGEDDSHVRKAFKAAFKANVPTQFADHDYTLVIAKDKKSLSVELEARIPTTLVKAAGIEEIKFTLLAFAAKPKPRVSLIASGGDVTVGSSDDAKKTQIMREIQIGLAEARRAGLPVPANLDAGELERLAEMILQQFGRR